jgi:hypothetical protein
MWDKTGFALYYKRKRPAKYILIIEEGLQDVGLFK